MMTDISMIYEMKHITTITQIICCNKAYKRVRNKEGVIIASSDVGFTKNDKLKLEKYSESNFKYIGFVRNRHEWKETNNK